MFFLLIGKSEGFINFECDFNIYLGFFIIIVSDYSKCNVIKCIIVSLI